MAAVKVYVHTEAPILPLPLSYDSSIFTHISHRCHYMQNVTLIISPSFTYYVAGQTDPS